jgi:hypothetical protein
MKFIKDLNNTISLIKTNGKKITVVSFLFTSLAFSSLNVTHAADRQALKKLNNIKTVLLLSGYTCRNAVGGGYLQQGQGYDDYNTLYQGTSYKLIAAGNVHVKDIDIVLHDENHNVIARDNSNDAMPIVDVRPRWTGRFHAKVKMYRGKGYSYLMVCYR